jgi:hypothetical protein
MSELLELVLNDTAARDDSAMPVLASSMAEKFLPWNDLTGV